MTLEVVFVGLVESLRYAECNWWAGITLPAVFTMQAATLLL